MQKPSFGQGNMKKPYFGKIGIQSDGVTLKMYICKFGKNPSQKCIYASLDKIHRLI